MLILVSNDDGVMAPGLEYLVSILKTYGKVVVVAPDGPRSGFSAAVTTLVPLRYELVSEDENVSVYKTNGTPVDCIKMGLNLILKDTTPDLIVSGINHGLNTSVSVHYSGTMGAVIEGCICGIPSVGFSFDDHSLDAAFSRCRRYIKRVLDNVIEDGLPSGVCLNVNFPNVEEIKGLKICRQMKGKWDAEFTDRFHPNGKPYYWLTGYFKSKDQDNTDTDIYAVKNGYASVVPVKVDMTDYDMLIELKTWE